LIQNRRSSGSAWLKVDLSLSGWEKQVRLKSRHHFPGPIAPTVRGHISVGEEIDNTAVRTAGISHCPTRRSPDTIDPNSRDYHVLLQVRHI